ncbi:riboflavin synthase domain-like protein [Lentinula raphanica]|uniref:NADPH-dependent diflavin oxidoreductase 1 n=1 Tax=Lentinula raphanica TaxID=153919 RepID=A0AA38U7N6_9AGAR|nr:riboflavin synthase domain-like protein [Lentinula raphanica]KAJ3818042.1 riboflavin synthase domain-like protein [Lentinula raphanica]KAJ3833849.1 riboflavin synthase domain-like protein [Lentinula raphanica]
MSTAEQDLELRQALILYATETGTAKDVADRVARECRRIHIQSRVLSMDAYSTEDLVSETLVIFIVSTTGSGSEPRTMTLLWKKLLLSSLPPDLLEDVRFTVFGLGDSAYEKFCWPAKRLTRRLESLGAVRLCECAEGDEQHILGIDGALEPWLRTLSNSLLKIIPLPPGTDFIPSDQVHPARVSLVTCSDSQTTMADAPLNYGADYFWATVKCNTRMTASDWYQDVRHIELDLDDSIEYSPGDVAVIHPIANADEVEIFLAQMGWGNFADDVLEIKHVYEDQSLPDYLPRYSTLRKIFTNYLDFNAVPRRVFFQYLRHFTSDETEKERLSEFLSLEHADELYDYCFRVRRTIQEVLSEFRNVHIPRDYIFDVFPPLRPRQFSIASSVKKHPRSIHLCVAMVRYKTKLKVPRRGVCSTYLAQLRAGERFRMKITKGFIQLPANDVPIICVGPGTGIAPMRAVIEERIQAKAHDNTLYFGCRSAQKDQHYASEWREYLAEHKLTYRVACSRDGAEGAKRTYVQDLITEDAARIWKLLDERKACVFISGSSNKMPAGVKASLKHAVMTHGSRSEQEASRFILDLERDIRLIEECWS